MPLLLPVFPLRSPCSRSSWHARQRDGRRYESYSRMSYGSARSEQIRQWSIRLVTALSIAAASWNGCSTPTGTDPHDMNVTRRRGTQAEPERAYIAPINVPEEFPQQSTDCPVVFPLVLAGLVALAVALVAIVGTCREPHFEDLCEEILDEARDLHRAAGHTNTRRGRRT